MREKIHFYFSRENEEGEVSYSIKLRFTGQSIEVFGLIKDEKIQVHEDYVRNQSKLLKFAYVYMIYQFKFTLSVRYNQPPTQNFEKTSKITKKCL